MSALRLIRLVAYAFVCLVLGASGLYVLVYLYRWEWNRAIVAGIFFLVALVTASSLLVVRGLRRVEARLARVEEDHRHLAALIGEENDRRATRHFEWLRRPPDHLGVFVPVLLGAGALLSIFAYVLERIAGAVGGPTLDRHTARLVGPDLPLGDGPRSVDAGPEPSRWPPLLTTSVVVTLIALGAWWAIDTIGDATQSRPEVTASPGETSIELLIDQRDDGAQRPAEVATTLWTACRGIAPAGVAAVRIEGVDDERALVVLDHQLGNLSVRRLTGCLEDLQADLVLAEVVDVERRPPVAPRP